MASNAPWGQHSAAHGRLPLPDDCTAHTMSPTIKPLSRLRRVDEREVWRHEAEDFTPWLAKPENLEFLGETLGMKLKLEDTEVGVGGYTADILAFDTTDNSRVVIENQLERTDHGHLGQILTYAAGLHALKVVWVAKQFTDEHRAALEWLNENTRENIRFFGLEIEVWRIGDSPAAPKFNIVAKPNDWTKNLPILLPPVKMAQREFWRGFADYAKRTGTKFRPTAPPAASSMTLAIGRDGFGLQAVAASSWADDPPELRTEFVLSGNRAAQRFKALERKRAQIDERFGEQFGDDCLVWGTNADTVLRKIYCMTRDPNWTDESQRDASHRWLTDRLNLLYEIFHGQISTLD